MTPELSLRPNEGSWNLRYGVLYIDQPIGTGFSTAGATPCKLKTCMNAYSSVCYLSASHQLGLRSPQMPNCLHALNNTCSAKASPLPGNGRIPTDEMEMAAHLYIGIQAFFARHADLRRRPFIITGESYAGKYVPSIGMRKPVPVLLWVDFAQVPLWEYRISYVMCNASETLHTCLNQGSLRMAEVCVCPKIPKSLDP